MKNQNNYWKLIGLIGLVIVSLGILVGCGEEAAPTDEETQAAAAIAAEESALVSATGKVVPVQEATLSFMGGGTVVDLPVAIGDAVSEGDLIASLDTSVLDAQIAEAEAAVEVAKVELERVSTPPHEEEIAEAEARVAAAQSNTSVAYAQQQNLNAPPEEYQVLQAQLDVMVNEQGLEESTRTLGFVVESQENQDDFYWFEVRSTYNMLDDTQRALEASQAALAESQERLEDLTNGPIPEDNQAAQAEVWAGSAETASAQADLANIEAGTRAEDIAIAEAAIAQAEAAVESAKVTRSRLQIVAPFDGVIVEVPIQPNQFVSPGEPVVLIADLDSLVVETTDLNEIDAAQVAVGDVADVSFDALPDIVEGTVTNISPMAEEGAGVNYTVTLELDKQPDNLLWGMTAFVDFY
ncbi:MAG: efflux RND transporter periplasmic adaptor subunit [Anaerolineae bacterium]|nr:efflux RND transporter periplasmic adaptor subunit [Anaerolineae bacterium]